MKKTIIVLFILLFTCGCDNNDVRTLNVLNWSSYIPNEVISDFSRLSKNWFKTFKGIATKYLGGYLSWFILFCKDKEFKDTNLIYELIAE